MIYKEMYLIEINVLMMIIRPLIKVVRGDK